MRIQPKNPELYEEVRKLVKRANQRLVRLERNFGINTWGSKILRKELDIEVVNAWTNSNRIRFNKKMTETQLIAIKKATQNFLSSKNSTVKGVKSIKQKQIKDLRISLSRPDLTVTTEEAETLYEFFGEDYASDITSKMPHSDDILAIMVEAREVASYRRRKYFMEQIEQYIEIGNDVDMKRKLGKLYRKYVK